MKRVSFKIAKVLKEAGYPQDELDSPNSHWFYDEENKCDILRMTYIEVWLWLWEEKNIQIDVVSTFEKTCVVVIWESGKRIFVQCKCIDPEDAIIAAIDYLVDNDLIK